MVRAISKRLVTALCVVVLACVAVGCTAQDTEAQDAQAANRQYMTQVNQQMEDLSANLSLFADAVSNNDVVSMRTQADSAFKVIDELAAVEAPEALADVQAEYVGGCAKLEEALSAYVALYTEIETATEEQPFDYGSYDSRLTDIQKLYDEGVAQLKAGDALAAGKE